MSEALTFPPLMSGERATGDAFEHAARRATMGCDAGLVAYGLGPEAVEATMVFAPEVPLARAMAMLPLCGVGLQNALGVLAPPEVAVHLDWDGGVRVNGAACGGFRAMASTNAPDAVPDWLTVGFRVKLIPQSDRPGETPDETDLYSEGCSEITPDALVETWARHTLSWIARWEDEGNRALHAEWRGLAHGIGDEVTQNGLTGTFMGVDEDFGMLIRDGETTRLVPLTTLLEAAP